MAFMGEPIGKVVFNFGENYYIGPEGLKGGTKVKSVSAMQEHKRSIPSCYFFVFCLKNLIIVSYTLTEC